MPRHFVIDTDTASDDAVALIMALRAPDVQVVAITTVHGNVGVEQATSNALYTVELCGGSTPVYMGAAKPLRREPQDATWFHGKDGLGDQGYAPSKLKSASHNAVDVILDSITAHPDLELVTLGPLTNIALALQRNPSIVNQVTRCVIMGGAPCCVGNVTPAAEYNIWTDPEAARIVLRSGLPIDLIGWHLCRGPAVLNDRDIARAIALDTDLARFAIHCNSHARKAFLEQTGEDGISLPDPAAMAIALDRSVGINWSRHHVDVETSSELTLGMTVVDQLNIAGNARNENVWRHFAGHKPSTDVCWTMDVARWKEALFAALGRRP
jgi:purine nucleosidase